MPAHRSFRLTISEDAAGQKVKLRVRRAAAFFTLALLFSALISVPLGVAIVMALGLADQRSPLVDMLGVLLFFGIVIAVQAVARIVLTRLFVRRRWLTPEEASEFKWMVNGYPSSCLEPSDKVESKATGSLSASRRENC